MTQARDAPPDDLPDEDPFDPFRSAVEARKFRLRTMEAARRELSAETAGYLDLPDGTDLEDLLAEPDEDARYRIDGLWPRRGTVILSAAYKAGKTTAVGNLVRSLVDGDRFLGIYKPDQIVDGVVALIDFEMPRTKIKEWMCDQRIRHRRHVKVWTLRGMAAKFNLLDEDIRARWAAKFCAAGTRVLILDCLGPILSALGLNESKNEEVGPLLDAIISMATAAGIEEVLIVHHMGHGPERARGASRLRDWPDVEWRLMRQRDDVNPFAEPDPNAPRFFAAFGRDVDVREGQLLFDAATRRLAYAEGNRRESRTNGALVAALTYVAENPGVSGRAIQGALTSLGVAQATARDTTKALVVDGLAVTADGPKNSRLHTIAPAGRAKLAALTVKAPDQDDRERVALSCPCGGVVPADMVDLGYKRCAPCLDADLGAA